jgi:hemolysin III
LGQVTSSQSVTTRAPRPGDVRSPAQHVLDEAIPRLRGWLHATTAPLAVVAGVVLVALSPTPGIRIGSTLFALSAVILFTASATLHRGGWSARTNAILTRLDHSSIFLLIAGSYTPFTLLLLRGSDRTTLLWVAWGGAAAGIAFRVLWSTAPRWVYTPIYIALGWAAVVFAGDFVRNGTPGVVLLLALGGLLYTVGAVVYGLRRPNPVPSWFGFHEVFHALTVVAFAAHYTGISMATYALR